MEYGKVLRFHRVKQGLTQNQLADGIISPAYLSKIENDQTVPAFEVLELLYERLGLDFLETSSNHPSKEKLKEWYEAIAFKRQEDAKRLKEDILNQKETQENHHLYIFFELFRIRHLLLENEVDEAYKAWENIRQYKDTFDEEMEFYYHLGSGLLKYYQGDFDNSFQELMEAKNYSSSINLEDWEFSDLYYLLALSTSQANHISASVFYVDQALEIYQSNYDLAKSADCHILQGINYSRLKNYAKALENFHLARKIALQTGNQNQLRLVFINIGTLESRIENHESAIINYKKSLEYHDSESEFQEYDYLTTIHGLIIENYRLGNKTGCLEWVHKGEEKLETFPSEAYSLHFEVYKKVINHSNNLSKFLEDTIIPFFQEKKEHIYVIRYAMFLADILEEQRMYKKSSTYLRLAIQLLNKHSNLGGILL
ncbi:Tetratricopeptide repeat-containing protein [Halobacillus alkaliphilus]|uniref:Tetratricopeptide repeat-containing protein n=1 Tax=Halobacillus alkaliphilus TaxID=396056 RepID=A0A1I2LXX8_9BACI|nr:helix-turn-helix transcriptional regulator [Halobacillus alkaliphilus]SFF82227.1 Tetratricopeptide repeat-containing protein [Halobacillus alkaliphilus]